MDKDDNVVSVFDFVRDKEKYKNWTSQRAVNELKKMGYTPDPELSDEENEKIKKVREILINMLQKEIDVANKLGMTTNEMYEYALEKGLIGKEEQEDEEDE